MQVGPRWCTRARPAAPSARAGCWRGAREWTARRRAGSTCARSRRCRSVLPPAPSSSYFVGAVAHFFFCLCIDSPSRFGQTSFDGHKTVNITHRIMLPHRGLKFPNNLVFDLAHRWRAVSGTWSLCSCYCRTALIPSCPRNSTTLSVIQQLLSMVVTGNTNSFSAPMYVICMHMNRIGCLV